MSAKIAVRLLFALGFVLLAVTNWMLLGQVTANRQGQADARLWLTERELPKISWLKWENSAMELRLNWRTLSRGGADSDDRMPVWLSGKKLEELGFRFADGQMANPAHHRPSLSRDVFLVLEYNGLAYREALRRAQQAVENEEDKLRANPGDKEAVSARQQAKKRIRSEELSQSRLFAVDAGTDPDQLRAVYSDPARFIIVPGLVTLRYRTEGNREWASGVITLIHGNEVHVPLELRRVLEPILRQSDRSSREGTAPRYAVELVFGSRRQPWIAAIRPLERPQEND